MNWYLNPYNSGVKLKPIDHLAFRFPDQGHLNGVETKFPAVQVGQTLTLSYTIKTIEGTPKFISLEKGGLAANFRPMLFNGDYAGEDSRWWPAGERCVFLKSPDSGSYSVQILPENFSNVFGKMGTERKDQFLHFLSTMTFVQLVFGGGNSYSHGVRVRNGIARFDLKEFYVK